MKEQQTVRKGRPRGRPFKPGESGNPAGRPPGVGNKVTQAMLAGIRQAEVELATPKLLDTSRPYESWDGYFVQDGIKFRKDTLEALPIVGPLPVQPDRLDPRERRTVLIWKRRRLLLQGGWLFDSTTWQAVKI